MYIKVRVQANSRKEVIKKKSDDHYIIEVKEKAERNMANRRVCEIISDIYGVSIKNVRIINGHQSPSKILSINI